MQSHGRADKEGHRRGAVSPWTTWLSILEKQSFMQEFSAYLSNISTLVVPVNRRLRNAGGLAAAGRRQSGGRAGVDSTRRGGPPRHGLLERGLARNSATAADLGPWREVAGRDGTHLAGQRALWRAAEIRWVGGGLAGRELEDRAARSATSPVRRGGRAAGAVAARFRCQLRIGTGGKSLQARLKWGPPAGSLFCRPAPIF
jgi:hypothetical protein